MNADHDQPGAGLQPPRFGLSSLLIVIALLGVMFAIIHYIGMYGFAIVGFFVLCVVAHIVGNAMGTKLREIGNHPPASGSVMARGRPLYGVTPTDFAPKTRLGERHALSNRVVIITAGGATIGGMLGAAGLAWFTGAETTWPVIALGATACAVLSGIGTFIASGFFQVSVSAWKQASREPRRRSDSK